MTSTQFTKKRRMESYLQVAYPVQLHREEQDGEAYWIAEVADLPGCMADGESPPAALRSLEKAKRIWLETAAAEGRPIPPPSQMGEFSGRVLLRLPRSMHRRLALRARTEDTSANQLIVMLLSEALVLRQAEGLDLSGRPAARRVAESRAVYEARAGRSKEPRLTTSATSRSSPRPRRP